LRRDCYEKFFPWLNSYLKYMKSKGVQVDAVSIQNEPDWWVDYSGCLYTPEQQLELVKNYAHMLDRETYKGVRLISAEPLGFDPRYSNMLLDDEVARDQIDIIAGHLYGHPPLNEMQSSAEKAAQYGKEVWMTEHSVSDNIKGRLPNWHEQLMFAEELNECMLAGGTGYIYWYMRAHWAFVGTGETQYGPDNIENKLLPRGLVMSHFSKYVTGSTRLKATTNNPNVPPAVDSGSNFPFETSAYIKGDSIIVIAIDTTGTSYDLKLKLPYYVKSGFEVLSTSNESLCKKTKFTYDEPTRRVEFNMPPRSLATFVFTIDREATDVFLPDEDDEEETAAVRYFDIHGRPIDQPDGLCIQQNADGTFRKVYLNKQ
jgi:glucuronoarabinoxylan endo-1,4-beta-xylanase